MINLLKKNDENIVAINNEIGKLVEDFNILAKSDPKFRSYFVQIVAVSMQIFRLHKQLHEDFVELKDCEFEKRLAKLDGANKF